MPEIAVARAPGVAERQAAEVERVARRLGTPASHPPQSVREMAVSHQVPKRDDKRRTDEKLDVSDLDEILEIDPVAMTCTAEPGVTFTDLVDATMELGLVPLVVPELRTITIGGAVSGCSLESMSFRHGGFHDTCLEYEVITAKGDVIRCTPEHERLLFQMMHGSFGTLGILSELTFRLVPAKRFVRLDHERYATLAEYKDAIRRRAADDSVDFLDGFVHGPRSHVLSVGRFVDDAPFTNRYDWLKVYYKSTTERREDWLATRHYFFRYDNGVTNVHPKSFLGRLLLGRFMHSAELLRLADTLHKVVLPASRPDVTVDLFIPFSKVDEFLAWHDERFGFYPLWCVPYRRVHDYEWIDRRFFDGLGGDDMFLDLAIYGMKQGDDGRNAYADIEAELLRINAIKTLISYNYYPRDVFWRIFDEANYAAVKRRTDPDNVLRDLYDKTCRAALGLD
jgi:FAD/FMN-containing dehydrogenase